MSEEDDRNTVIIAGGRDFTDYNLLIDCCQSVLVPTYEEHINRFISGGADGADILGEKYVQQYWADTATVMRPEYAKAHERADYKKWNRVAPLRRNRAMAEAAAGGVLIAFLGDKTVPGERGSGLWQGHGGTWNMINNAIACNMETHIFRYPTP